MIRQHEGSSTLAFDAALCWLCSVYPLKGRGNIQEMQLHDTRGNRNASRDLQISFEENAGWLLLICLKILAIIARSQVS